MGIEKNKDFAAGLTIGDIVAVRSHNVGARGQPYFIMRVIKLRGDLGVLAQEGSQEECNLFCRITGTVVGQRERFVEPVTTEILEFNSRAEIFSWISGEAEFDLLRIPYADQREIFEKVRALICRSA